MRYLLLLIFLIGFSFTMSAQQNNSEGYRYQRDTIQEKVDSVMASIERLIEESNPWKFSLANGGDTFYVLKKAQKKEGAFITVWIKDISKQVVVKGKTYKNATLKILLLVDCEEHKYGLKTSITYDAKGLVIDDWTEDYPDMKYVVPETVMEGLTNTICNLHYN